MLEESINRLTEQLCMISVLLRAHLDRASGGAGTELAAADTAGEPAKPRRGRPPGSAKAAEAVKEPEPAAQESAQADFFGDPAQPDAAPAEEVTMDQLREAFKRLYAEGGPKAAETFMGNAKLAKLSDAPKEKYGALLQDLQMALQAL